MPRLWNQTVDAHRHEVRQAIMDTTAALVAEQGLRAVTMSEIAEKTGIGRATLYKYFRDVEAILLAWHERHITGHLDHLAKVREGAANPGEELRAVLEAYAIHTHESRSHRDTELAALVHSGDHVARAQKHLSRFIAELLRKAVTAGHIRDDIEPAELAAYCLHALSAASSLSSVAAVRRLVNITLDALSPAQNSV